MIDARLLEDFAACVILELLVEGNHGDLGVEDDCIEPLLLGTGLDRRHESPPNPAAALGFEHGHPFGLCVVTDSSQARRSDRDR